MDDILLKSINYHNNINYKSFEIRDVDKIDIINIVNKNIEKSILGVIKYKNIFILWKNDFLLVNDNMKTIAINTNDLEIVIKK